MGMFFKISEKHRENYTNVKKKRQFPIPEKVVLEDKNNHSPLCLIYK